MRPRPPLTAKGRTGIATGIDEPEPAPHEKLAGNDELDEDDEMVLSAGDLVEETPEGA